MRVVRRATTVLGAVAICLAALGLGYATRCVFPTLGLDVAAAQDDTTAAAPDLPTAVGEMYTVGGGIVRGKLMIGGKEVLRLGHVRNGLEPLERVTLAAARINLALGDGARPEDFSATQTGDEWAVVAGDREIIGVAPGEPALYKKTAEGVAQFWAAKMVAVLKDALGTDAPLPPLDATARAMTVEGREAAALVINGQEALRVTSRAAGLSPFERMNIVADRLRQAVSEGALPQDIRASTVYGMSVVQVSETLLITIDQDEAARAGKAPDAMATEWANRLSGAVASHYAFAGRPAKAPAQVWVPAEPYEDKWVPIISVLEGVRLGAARVNGPASKVRTVQAVAQLETHWKDKLEVDVLVPISTNIPGKTLSRVKGCGVTGLGDLRL